MTVTSDPSPAAVAAAERHDGGRVALWVDRHRRESFWILTAGLILFGTLIRLRQVGHILWEDHAFRETQTAWAVREFAENGINLFISPLPVFGPEASVPMEFPIFQALASLLVPLGLDAGEASRLLGIISFQATALLLTIIVARWHGRLAAVVALGLFQVTPFSLMWGGASLMEFFATALALAMVLGFGIWLDSRSKLALVLGSFAAILAFLVKVTTAPCWAILLLAVVYATARQQGLRAIWRRALLGLIVGPGLGLIAGVAWSRYADAVKATNPVAYVWKSSELTTWNFGTLDQRADPTMWSTLYYRIADLMAGPFCVGLILGALAVIVARSHAQRALGAGWLAVAASGPLVFFNLYVVHEYYLAAIYPAVVVVTALGITWLARVIARATRRGTLTSYSLAAAAAGLIFFLTVTTSYGSLRYFDLRYLNLMPEQATVIAENTEEDDLVVMIGCGMDPSFLFLADRRGMQIAQPEEVDPVWEYQDIDDYSFLYRCNDDLRTSNYLPEGYAATRVEGELFAIERE